MNKQEKAIALVKKGEDVGQRNANGATPLHAAVELDQTAVARALLEAGADVNARMPAGETPIFFVWKHKNTEILQLLVAAGADVSASSSSGLSVLCVMFQGIADEGALQKAEVLGEILLKAGASPDLGGFAGANAPPCHAWASYFLAKHAGRQGSVSLAAERYRAAAGVFESLARDERARSRQLREHAKGAFGRNVGRAIAAGLFDGLVGGLTGVQVNTYPGFESKKATLAQAEHAETLAALYERALADCSNQSLHAQTGSR